MKRFLTVLSLALCTAGPALADGCAAATEAATRSALKSAEASDRRTSTVRVSCEAEHITLVLHRVNSPSGSIITVREVRKPVTGQVLDVATKRDFSNSTSARLIRVTD